MRTRIDLNSIATSRQGYFTNSQPARSCAEIDIPAGNLNIGVMYAGVPIFAEDRDLCDMASCPIKTGAFQISYDQPLPPIVPPVSCTDSKTLYASLTHRRGLCWAHCTHA